MKHRIELKQKCIPCGGTGLYSGMGESEGCAVVCSSCKGTGCQDFVHEYEDFEGLVEREDVKRVYQTNPGIKIGEGNGYRLEDFGGIPYENWKAGKPFRLGTENRKFTCPAWWYQSADYKKKPRWKECIGIGSFSSCPYFGNMEECWRRFDKELEQGKPKRR